MLQNKLSYFIIVYLFQLSGDSMEMTQMSIGCQTDSNVSKAVHTQCDIRPKLKSMGL